MYQICSLPPGLYWEKALMAWNHLVCDYTFIIYTITPNVCCYHLAKMPQQQEKRCSRRREKARGLQSSHLFLCVPSVWPLTNPPQSYSSCTHSINHVFSGLYWFKDSGNFLFFEPFVFFLWWSKCISFLFFCKMAVTFLLWNLRCLKMHSDVGYAFNHHHHTLKV